MLQVQGRKNSPGDYWNLYTFEHLAYSAGGFQTVYDGDPSFSLVWVSPVCRCHIALCNRLSTKMPALNPRAFQLAVETEISQLTPDFL